MKTNMNQAQDCPSCGRPLPQGALAGLCPACLLAQGAETKTTSGGRTPGFVLPPLEKVASLFPQLEILGLLGAGGMGAVYRGRQPALDRFVALKILPAAGAGTANSEERFNREARALARLNHPNIVTVHEFGQAGDWHYFVMEFVDGANLRQLEKAGRLAPREALQIVPQICDALQYAHDEGVVHRDIKPENVLVDRKGRVKIADFGLAKILGQEPDASRLTRDGQVMGTPHYMAPEQIERPLTVDHRADIYSLGVVLYEMLTGDLPLGKFPPPSRKVQVDVRLDEVVLRALENDPDRRYQHASEVKSGVETITSAPVQLPPATTEARKTDVRYLGWRFPFAWPAWLTGRRLAAASLVVLAWFVFQVQWLTPRLRLRGAMPPAIQAASTNLEAGALFATLPGGGLAELLAIGEPEAVPTGWWTPDGTPVNGTAFAVTDICEIRDRPGDRQRDMIFRFASLPEGVTGPVFRLDPPAATGGGGVVLQDGRELAGGSPIRVAWPREGRTCNVSVGFGLADWKVVARHEPMSRSGSVARTLGKPDWDIVFHGAAPSEEGTQATYVFGQDDQNWRRRVVAIDHKGGEHPHTSESSSQTGASSVWTFNFHSIAPHSIRELQVQMRLLQWVEFRNVALNPTRPVPAPVHACFGPAAEVTFTGVLDLDTGKVADSSRVPGAGSLEGVSWMREGGYEAQARRRTLGLVETRIVYLDARNWDDMTPGRLGYLIRDGGTTPAELQAPIRDLPVTVGFRTRDGTTGILQVLAYGKDGVSPTVRIKWVQSSGASPHQVLAPPKPPHLREEKAHLAALLVDYGESHPEVRKAKARIAERERLFREEPDAPVDLREEKVRLAGMLVDYSESHPEVRTVLARIAELERLSREEPNAPADWREAKAHLAELRISYGEAHPEVQQALARIKTLEGK